MANILTCSSLKEFLGQKNKFGGVETMMCAYAILSPYGIGLFRFDMILPLVIGCLAVSRQRYKLYVNYNPFLFLFGYIVLHDFFLCIFLDTIPSYHINATIVTVLMLIPTFLVTKSINYDKFVNALVIISFVVVLGVFYHVLIIMAGGEVTPIKIPFLPFNEVGTRLTEEGGRPKSFFLEPSNVNNYLMFPLFLSLYYRKIVFAAFIILGLLLASSTNAIVTTSVMLLVFLLTQKSGWKNCIIILIMIPIFVGIYLTSAMFETGRTKVETTDLEQNVRMVNGPMLVAGMPKEHLIMGFPSPNVDDYKNKTNYITDVYLATNADGIIFVSGFWKILARFGVIGMFIFLFAHYKLYRQCKGILLFLIPSFVLLFSGGNVGMDGSLFEWTVYVLSFSSYERMRCVKDAKNGRYPPTQNGDIRSLF